jgi:hypothetical protein
MEVDGTMTVIFIGAYSPFEAEPSTALFTGFVRPIVRLCQGLLYPVNSQGRPR